MLQQVEANWVVLGAVALVVLLIGWWLASRNRKPARREYKPDVLDEGVGPAQRNQALIDAAPVAVITPPAAEILGGIAEVIDAAVQEEVAEAAPAPAPEPVVTPEPAPAPAPAPAADADDLSRIKGLGPKLKTILTGLGVTSFAQIAAWSEEDMARIDAQLGAFAGRPAKDNWIEQARLLAAGNTEDYEAKFGKL